MKIVADTSFLMAPGLFNLDITDELSRVVEGHFEIVVPSNVVDELKKISESGGQRERAAARVGLEMVSRARVLDAEGNADEAILEMAVKNRWAVATNDGELRRRLRRAGVAVIYLRGMSHLAISPGSQADRARRPTLYKEANKRKRDI